MGSVWSRYGDSVSFGDDWPRALAHELGHYALFLDDNYVGRNSTNQLVSIDTCPGAMSNPYRDDYTEFHPDSGWLPECQHTLSNVETGRSDWATIQAFYHKDSPVLPLSAPFQLNAPATFDAVPGPAAQILNFTQITTPAPTSATLAAPVFSLVQVSPTDPSVTTRYTYAPGMRVRAVLYTDSGNRLLDLGRPNQDQLLARGAKIGDQVCVYDLTRALAGCATAAPGVAQIKLRSQGSWQPDIQINPLSGAQIEIVVPASGVIPPGQAAPTLTATFFNDRLAGPAPSITLTASGGTYRGTFVLGQPVSNGYIRLRTTENVADPNWREVATDFTLFGEPLASKASAPKLSDCIPGFRCAPTLATSSDGQMLIYGDPLQAGQFYLVQTATNPPPAPPWGIMAGQAYRLNTAMTAKNLADNHVAITAAYLESELPAGTEGGLAIYYSADGNVWRRLTTTRFDPDKNEISATPVGAGIYALISRIEVQEGWNTLSYPWPDTLPVLTATAKLNILPGRHFTTIHSYEQQDVADHWKVYDVDAPAWVNDLTQLAYGKGYWFIVPRGGATPPLLAGATTLDIGVPVPPATYYGVLPHHDVPAVVGQEVQAISAGKVCSTAKTFIPANTRQVGYVIQVLPAGQGAPEGCGIMGQPVTIMVGGKPIQQTIWDNSRPITFHDIYAPVIFGPPAAALASAQDSTGSAPSTGTSTGTSQNDRWVGQQVP
jgi:hypothetical protein